MRDGATESELSVFTVNTIAIYKTNRDVAIIENIMSVLVTVRHQLLVQV